MNLIGRFGIMILMISKYCHAESFIALRQGKIILESGKINAIPVEDGICHIKNNIANIIL